MDKNISILIFAWNQGLILEFSIINFYNNLLNVKMEIFVWVNWI